MINLVEFLVKKHQLANVASEFEEIEVGDCFSYEFTNIQKNKSIVFGKCTKKQNSDKFITLYTDFFVCKVFDKNDNPIYANPYGNGSVWKIRISDGGGIDIKRNVNDRSQTFRELSQDEINMIEEIDNYAQKNGLQKLIGTVDQDNNVKFR